jgi:AraC-like DNA-binding protein
MAAVTWTETTQLGTNSVASRARAVIVARPEHQLTAETLAHACGVSVRSLHRAFVREFGVTPLQFLRRCRLERIRTDLQAARPGTTVTRVAIEWGVTHLSRFAREYADVFGESPSCTLRRALAVERRVSAA